MLDPDLFAKNLRIARRGAGMTSEHLRPLLEHHGDMTRFWRFAQDLARIAVPNDIAEPVRLGRMTALPKANGGVRGSWLATSSVVWLHEQIPNSCRLWLRGPCIINEVMWGVHCPRAPGPHRPR